jgi:sialic acid synthase SpsE
MSPKIEIIAEIAQGYEGSSFLANFLAKSAINSGATAIKFQMVFADEICIKKYEHYKLFKRLEMSLRDWSIISNITSKNKIQLYFDIFGLKSLNFCEKINASGIKIHPTDTLNYYVIKNVAKSKIKKIILGVGGHNLDQLDQTIKLLIKKDIIIMTGFQSYPTYLQSNNIKNLSILKNKYKNFKNIKFGFADHEAISLNSSKMLSTLALGAGATVIEKHFTISKNLKLEDSESALEPKEFEDFSLSLKKIFKAYSENSKLDKYSLSQDEKNYLKKVQRNIVAKKLIKKGMLIKYSDIILKRTGEKNVLYNFNQCLGRMCSKNIKKNFSIKKNHLL